MNHQAKIRKLSKNTLFDENIRHDITYNTTDHKEGEQLEDQRSVGASNCNSGNETDQRVQSLMFMMKITILHIEA